MTGAVGVLWAAGAAACFGAGIPLQARRARQLPELAVERLRAVAAFLCDARWVAATLLVAAGWALEVGALSRAPAMLVFPTAAGGIAVTSLVSSVLLGEGSTREEGVGVALVLLGIGSAALSAGEGVGSLRVRVPALVVAELVLVVAASACVLGARASRAAGGAATAAGFLYSGSGLLTTALGAVLGDGSVPATSLVLVVLVALLAGLGALALQVALQRGRVTSAVTVCTAISSLLPGLLAIPVLGQAWPSGLAGFARATSLLVSGFGVHLLGGIALERRVRDGPPRR